jgi:hypothetical protein
MPELDYPDEKLIQRFETFTAQHVGEYAIRGCNVQIEGASEGLIGSIQIDERFTDETGEGTLTTAYDLDTDRNMFKTVEFVSDAQRERLRRVNLYEDMFIEFDMILHDRTKEEAYRELVSHKLRNADPKILNRLMDSIFGPLNEMENRLGEVSALEVIDVLDGLEVDLSK